MAESFKKLAQLELLTSNAVAIYTVPVDTEAVIKHIKVFNTSGVSIAFELWQGGTADVNKIGGIELGPGEFSEFNGNVLAETGEVFHASATVTPGLTLTMYGLEISE
jgi:hypothetical protein